MLIRAMVLTLGLTVGCGGDSKNAASSTHAQIDAEAALNESAPKVAIQLEWVTPAKRGEPMQLALHLNRNAEKGAFSLVSLTTVKEGCGCKGYHKERTDTLVGEDLIKVENFKFNKPEYWTVHVKYRVGEKEYEHLERIYVAD